MSGAACIALREELECLDLTCRIGGCDYGFVLSPDNRCPLCECRNICDEVICGQSEECQMVDVNCDNEYCSPVPACKFIAINELVYNNTVKETIKHVRIVSGIVILYAGQHFCKYFSVVQKSKVQSRLDLT